MINLINSILPVLCLCVGFFVGYKLNTNKTIELPEIIKHPKKYIKRKIKENQEIKKAQEEIDYLNDVLYNIENYDGTGKGLKKVRRGEND